MEIILLESFDKLGKIGDVVNVKDGFARNFLLPQKKALRANKSNKEYYEKIKSSLQEKNNELIKNAKEISTQLQTKEITFIRQASETGQLYGSVSPKDISNYFKDENILIAPSNINLTTPIKKTGIFEVKIKLHADVLINVSINVAISEESAIEQKKISISDNDKKLNKITNSSDEQKLVTENIDKEIDDLSLEKDLKKNVDISDDIKIDNEEISVTE
jgi:large subunit ribosomal protein L9